MCDILTMLKFPMFCASNQKCPIIKVSYLLWDSYAHSGRNFLLTSNNACAKLSLLQYLIFALAKHRLRVSQTVLLCPFDIAYLCLFYPAIYRMHKHLTQYEYSHCDCALFLPSKRRKILQRAPQCDLVGYMFHSTTSNSNV